MPPSGRHAQPSALPVSIERSRSGKGAHAWFFFDAPVAAAAARSVGCHLITRAMSMRHGIPMTSYDRLFPNQDTMPRGGFGNLIALPLQRGPRAEGNSVFVDDEFRPFADQWAYLAGVQRIAAATVERVAGAATRGAQVLAVRAGGTGDGEPAAPWRLPPSGPSPPPIPVVKEPLPARVQATLAQQLFVTKADLPSPVIHALMRLAAFQNPEFHQRQRMRLSTARVPRVIACARDLGEHLALPRGCTEDAVSLLRSLGVTLEIEDLRERGRAIEYRFMGTPTELQESAVRALLAHDMGVLVAPPGVGKTVAGIQLIASRGCSTLILVHRRPLLDQWVAQLALFFGVEPRSIGRIGGGQRRVTGDIDVATIQSLVRKGVVADLVAGLRARGDGRMPPRGRAVVRDGSFGGQGTLRDGIDGHSQAARWTPPDPGDATGAGAPCRRSEIASRGMPLRASGHRPRDILCAAGRPRPTHSGDLSVACR